jgi:hypothetical protein
MMCEVILEGLLGLPLLLGTRAIQQVGVVDQDLAEKGRLASSDEGDGVADLEQCCSSRREGRATSGKSLEKGWLASSEVGGASGRVRECDTV